MESQNLRPLPNVKFRVLVAGRANAGKTTILQRVCETTESPKVYQVTIDHMGREIRSEKIQLNPSSERGKHDISDELVFSNHTGYIFHDTRGFESGGTNELHIVKDFILDRSRRRSLSERLHAIWYCIPMDNQRPELNIEPYRCLCLAENVPVIAVFTKYEAFRRNVCFGLEDKYEREILSEELDWECQKIFATKYLGVLGQAGYPASIFVCLEGMNKPEARCQSLVQATVDALSPDTVALILVAMRGNNIRLNVHLALKKNSELFRSFTPELSWNGAVKRSMQAFPVLWACESNSLTLLI
ncbi:hypothetical protein B0H19DRAFT_994295 [Mycena capillaripes]|nr:hypothetical protein B0H19DRAFT_994295 [Mycena capillaripes]